MTFILQNFRMLWFKATKLEVDKNVNFVLLVIYERVDFGVGVMISMPDCWSIDLVFKPHKNLLIFQFFVQLDEFDEFSKSKYENLKCVFCSLVKAHDSLETVFLVHSYLLSSGKDHFREGPFQGRTTCVFVQQSFLYIHVPHLLLLFNFSHYFSYDSKIAYGVLHITSVLVASLLFRI